MATFQPIDQPTTRIIMCNELLSSIIARTTYDLTTHNGEISFVNGKVIRFRAVTVDDGQRVIQDTIREQLPEGFQRSEYLEDHGMIDRVVHRKDIRDELAVILRLLMNQPARVVGDLPTPQSVEPAEAAE